MAGIYLLRYVPEETRNRLLQPIFSGDITSIVVVASVILMVLSLGLYATAKARFQRTRLILDE